MLTGIILILISVCIFLVASVLLLNIHKTAKNGVSVKGIVFSKEAGDDPTSYNSYPIVRFVTEKGDWMTLPYKFGFIPGLYKVGKEVTVKYQKENPSNFIIDDKFSYLIPTFFIVIGLFLIGLGIMRMIQV
jgi:Protein of unknown function (DUF3592)